MQWRTGGDRPALQNRSDGLDRARAFYEGCLGLKPGGFRPDGKLVYAVGGSTLALFPKPEGTKADHTAIRFKVADIAA